MKPAHDRARRIGHHGSVDTEAVAADVNVRVNLLDAGTREL